MQSEIKKVSVSDFANHFGTSTNDFDSEIKKMINDIDFSYFELSERENSKTILEILKKIELDEQKIASKAREDVWQKGWNENYEEFIKSNYSLDTLIPKFIRPNQLIRLNRRFIKPNNNWLSTSYYFWLHITYN